jgi:hypothetical protein
MPRKIIFTPVSSLIEGNIEAESGENSSNKGVFGQQQRRRRRAKLKMDWKQLFIVIFIAVFSLMLLKGKQR